jgi:hypothetical protein
MGKLPQGSFVVAPVHSVAELVEQVKESPTLMSRYVQVYRRTPEEITEYLSKLRLVSLSDDFVANVYFVYPDGTAAYRTRRVKRGTKIFVDPEASNRPILVQACGNPLTNVAPIPELLGPEPLISTENFSEDEPLPKRIAVLPAMTMVDMAPSRIATPTNIISTRLAVVPPPLGLTRLVPVPPLTPPIPPITPPFFPPIIPPIFPRDGDNPNPPEIPEPGTVALALSSLGSGVLLQMNARRRRNR